MILISVNFGEFMGWTSLPLYIIINWKLILIFIYWMCYFNFILPYIPRIIEILLDLSNYSIKYGTWKILFFFSIKLFVVSGIYQKHQGDTSHTTFILKYNLQIVLSSFEVCFEILHEFSFCGLIFISTLMKISKFL